jgi:hypothetical protein
MSNLNDAQRGWHTARSETNVGASGAAVTLTVPAPNGGLFAHLVWAEILMYAVAALTGGATPVTVTTTGLVDDPAFTFPTAQAIGLVYKQELKGPVKGSTADTALTIVCPATTNVIWRVNAVYFYA